MMKLTLSTLAVAFLSVSCISGPKEPSRTMADRLNGENYESTNVVMGVPVLQRKRVERKFSGRVFCGEGLSQTPVNHASVSLIQNGQTLRTTSSNADGTFHLAAPVDEEHESQLRASANCGQAVRPLEKQTTAEGLDLVLKKSI